MKILGVETSCDETAIAVLEILKNKMTVLSNIVSSQVKLHAKYGGVVPHLAAREHEKNLPRVLKLALKRAQIKNIKKDVDLIAITIGPGLSPALWRGVNFAKKLAKKYRLPLIGVNHLEGHIYSNWLKSIGENSKFPALNLIVSGGHTILVLMKNYGKYKLIGETRDDAVGEAFDKIARLLNLGYPGGPVISARADKFETPTFKSGSQSKSVGIKFPRPMINSKDCDFSFSGLKTAVLYKLKDLQKQKVKLTKNLINQICHEVQQAITDVLVSKTIKAAKEFRAESIMLSGGVSANKFLRQELEKESKKLGLCYSQPNMQYTTDNAAMIALAGYFNFTRPPVGRNKKTDLEPVNVDANLIF